ncbi:MAG: 2-oxoacid:ferredoxin oxidoreductase subunit gamma [Thermotoga sp.]|nr:MAG: 2-oxoacid:ferredoxin oxidoreductase subunit gamma [Thermotoga sp.]
MNNKLIAAGFGGQGMMLLGQLIAYAGMLEGKHVTWLPSYGPEMRGGTANCTVIVSDKPIGAPVVAMPTEIIAMNIPSMLKFTPTLVEKGKLFLNSSMIDREPGRTDIEVMRVPANEIADELGNLKVANIVMLGAYIKKTGILSQNSIKSALEHKLVGKKKELLELDIKAFEKGTTLV